MNRLSLDSDLSRELKAFALCFLLSYVLSYYDQSVMSLWGISDMVFLHFLLGFFLWTPITRAHLIIRIQSSLSNPWQNSLAGFQKTYIGTGGASLSTHVILFSSYEFFCFTLSHYVFSIVLYSFSFSCYVFCFFFLTILIVTTLLVTGQHINLVECGLQSP